MSKQETRGPWGTLGGVDGRRQVEATSVYRGSKYLIQFRQLVVRVVTGLWAVAKAGRWRQRLVDGSGGCS